MIDKVQRGLGLAFEIIKPTVLILFTGTAISISVFAVISAVSTESRPRELELIIVLIIAALFVVIASAFAALANKVVNPEATNQENSRILREGMSKFT